MKDRVVIFIDYQNVIKVARNYFLDQNSSERFELGINKIASKLMEHKNQACYVYNKAYCTGNPHRLEQSLPSPDFDKHSGSNWQSIY